MSSLKSKTIHGILWSAVDSLAAQGITFLVGIVLARLLSPAEFGLVGMITVFIAVSESFINSGFSEALIRKKNCTEIDYSTVFYFNLLTGILFFIILFFSGPLISSFFKEPQLNLLVKVLAFVLIIDSLTMIQRTTLTKRIDFKLQTRISVISALTGGAVGIWMAYSGFGVWSLVFKTLIQRTVNSLLLWVWNRWRPMLVFSLQSFRELFTFGSRLLISGLIDTFYRNIYYLVIGKYFSAQELGYYTRAQQFNDLPSKNLNGIMSRVTYPVLAKMQDDPVKLKSGYKKMIKSIMLISMVLMAGLAAMAEPMIITLIGEKWRPAVIYLQLLTFVGMTYPLHALNLNMLQVQGRSDLFLRLEIIKKLIAIPTIIIGVYFGIKIMILGMWVNTLIAYYLNSYWSGRMINYPMREQVMDILPGFGIAVAMGGIVILAGWLIPVSFLLKMIIQLILGTFVTFFLCEFFKPEAYLELRQIILKNMLKR
jgi:O-antigen/teichoic acid export membrane protein